MLNNFISMYAFFFTSEVKRKIKTLLIFSQMSKYHGCLGTVTHIFENSIFHALGGPLK